MSEGHVHRVLTSLGTKVIYIQNLLTDIPYITETASCTSHHREREPHLQTPHITETASCTESSHHRNSIIYRVLTSQRGSCIYIVLTSQRGSLIYRVLTSQQRQSHLQGPHMTERQHHLQSPHMTETHHHLQSPYIIQRQPHVPHSTERQPHLQSPHTTERQPHLQSPHITKRQAYLQLWLEVAWWFVNGLSLHSSRNPAMRAQVGPPCYLGKRHSGTLVIIYPLLCNISLNIRVKAIGSSSLCRFSYQALAVLSMSGQS